MAFDQTTRNRLARFVSDTRALLTEEFTRQLQNEYGLDPASGEVTPIERLTALDDRRRETAHILRETLDYYLAGNPKADAKAYQDVLDRIVREQAFTVLNRLCALRMSEARGLVLESIAKGYQSKGFQLYARLAGSALGETGEAYRSYLFSIMDEFAVDLPILFDRFSPQGRLFPREAALLKLLELINDPEIEPLWTEDETIGWVYQYFNSREERKAMRDASQAPRNSRELAVRNQFFTPRYVVEFLTDNTLGRIWYEMTRGETTLNETCRYLVRRPNEIFLDEGEEVPEQSETDENLSQEELLRLPVYIPHRQLKDPREIKMLDPACGSMHFGLYAFDLFEQIYAEAWELEERLGEDALQRLADLESLHKTYPDKAAFLRDMPRLIIERNIHGVDIDPRAVQIAGLSLWLRAQKSWQAQGIKSIERPQIRKSNVVCAEPMPGDRQMLEEFLATLREDKLEALMRKTWNLPIDQKIHTTRQMTDALAKLVRTVWQEMELAGEAGSLLKIEEILRGAIVAARKESEEKSPLFRVLEYGLNENPKEQTFQLVSGEEQDFFDRAEGLVLSALSDYANQAENGGGYRRRLFAEDTTQGFAFIDLCRKRYDVTVMNPPFGLATDKVFEKLRIESPDTFVELYASFVQRAIIFTPVGLIGAITSRGFFTMTRLTQWRRKNFASKTILVYDLGLDVMDNAFVRSSAYILSGNAERIPILVMDANKSNERAILAQTENWNSVDKIREGNLFIRLRQHISMLPESKFLYKAGPEIVSLFSSQSKFEGNGGEVRTGLTTFNDDRFLRLLWEIPLNDLGQEKKWNLFSKGGDYAKYYTDIHLVINRYRNGQELAEVNRNLNGQVAQSRQGSTYYFKPGLTFTSRSGLGISVRALPSGSVISHNAPTIYPIKNMSNKFLLGWINSRLIKTLIEIQSSADYYTPGSVKMVPWIDPPKNEYDLIVKQIPLLVNDYCFRSQIDETSPLFECIYLGSDIRNTYEDLLVEIEEKKNRIKQSQAEISKLVDEIYGIDSKSVSLDLLENDSDNDVPIDQLSSTDYTICILSYIVGCLFGRWNILFASKKEKILPLLDPFIALPTCPPGMLQNDQAMPAKHQELNEDYPLRISWQGILINDEGRNDDIGQRLREALHVIWKDKAEVIEQEICLALGLQSLNEFFQKSTGFFSDHLKRYSKSRRAAPIYWPLSTPSCTYTLWLYYHRLNDQTLYTCVNDFVDPKLKQVSDEAARLRMKKSRSPADEKELERLTDFERELKDFREELLRVAKFWKPNLNDGVEITAAPLWKLFQYKPWQKRLKETWQKLETGEYDWSNMAYNIWPERVCEKCKSDKSMAITHDLEVLFVEPPASVKKKKAKKPAVDEETEGRFNDD